MGVNREDVNEATIVTGGMLVRESPHTHGRGGRVGRSAPTYCHDREMLIRVAGAG
jgi:hypothetical protein